MITALVLGSCLCAAVFGCLAFHWYRSIRAKRTSKRLLLLSAGAEPGGTLHHQAVGLADVVVGFMEDQSRKGGLPRGKCVWWRKLVYASSEKLMGKVAAAGLSGTVTADGLVSYRVKACGVCFGAGLLVGALFSWQLSALLGVLGLVFAVMSVPWALKAEADARRVKVESELSQMLEVVSLGLASGLSFERSLELYCHHFSSFLSSALESCMHQWEWGLMSREDALKQLARQFDSPIFTRAVDTMVRSLRFGISIVSVLEETAAEARDMRKAHLEERIAKAPIKMMIPVGTLILPAMLLLVLGPVLLELMEGF